MKFRKNVWKVQMVLRFLRACVFKEKEVREGGFKFHRYKKGCLCFCRMNQAFKAHFDSWEPGHYSEEVELVKDVRTDEQRKEFLALFAELAPTKKSWKEFLSCFAAAAAVYYKNPSFAAFYERKDVGSVMIARLKTHEVPRVSEIESELFDVFVATIEHNREVYMQFIPALKKTLEKTTSYQDLYGDYLTNYLRLYRHSFKLSSEELLMFRDVVLKKIAQFGMPKPEELKAFSDIAETFDVTPYTLQEVEEEFVIKKFLFSKKEKRIVKKQMLRPFNDIVKEIGAVDATNFR